MTKGLFIQAVGKFALGVLLAGALLFLPAGTLDYRNAWILMGLLFLPMFCAGVFMMCRDPARLEKRLKARETQSEQKAVVALSGLMFIGGFTVSGLGVRFGWPMLPEWVTGAASVVFLLSYLLYAEVLRENAFLSRTVEIQAEQTVIDTGLYGIVRHPMYAATLPLFLSMPLILGSPFAFLIFLVYPLIIVRRLNNEEQVLAEGLAGYADYQRRVKYRLIPFVW